MSAEELEELAIAYLLGELDEGENTAFEQRLAQDPAVSLLVDDLEKTMGLTALAETELVDPSSGLKDRLLSTLPDRESQVADSEDPQDDKVIAFPIYKEALGVVGWAAAACLTIFYYGQREATQGLEAERNSVLTQNKSLEAQVDTLSRESNATLARNEALAVALSSALETTNTLQTRLEEVSRELAEASTDRDKFQAIVTNLRQQSVLDKVQIAALSSEVDELRYGFAVWDTQGERGIAKVFNL